ncbi:hypothetical protein ACJJTC_008252 [Scirpophaga incertulas]
MAGNKVTTKTKGKEAKLNRNTSQTIEENESIDFSHLRRPIQTSVTGIAQAIKIFDIATEELKGLISNESDLIFECKVCRSLFRSLANFISHKRVYCKEQFNTSLHGQFFKMNSTASEVCKIRNLEEKYFESLKEKDINESVHLEENEDRIPITKDLTTIIEKIIKNKPVANNINDEPQLSLQKIPSSTVAVFQNYGSTDETLDKMKVQVKELDNILAQNKAVLQSNGKFKIQSSSPLESDNIIHISDDDEEEYNDNVTNINTDELICKICDLKFSTLKTLKFHMKYKHLESRLVYPCPDCLEIFSTSWSVYRHLFKVHRKTAAQIRRLRESVHTKAFRMNNPPAFYEKRKNKQPAIQKITEEERLNQENQAWMNNVEGDSNIPRCFGCGRTFERRAALAAHTHTCQPRSRVLARKPQEIKKIEIQIRKDYNKGSSVNQSIPQKSTESNEIKSSCEDVAVITLVNESENKDKDNRSKIISIENLMDVDEIDDKSESSPEKLVDSISTITANSETKLPFAQSSEKSNLTAFRQKIEPVIEIAKLLCKLCDIQHETLDGLYEHMAHHYKWMRYACKLCNFKNYNIETLPEHVKVVHKLKGDKHFIFTTVKAIDGTEALELSEFVGIVNDRNDINTDARRHSRCSSDSSRLSDDSSSSHTRIEGSRKRKTQKNKLPAKKKRENIVIEEIEDIESKKSLSDNIHAVASRRPVRKKTKVKNSDFEYDLSNLLKMEAQGYREAQSIGTKTNQIKKKTTQSETLNNYEILNKDCNGALATLSRKAVEKAAAHVKNNFLAAVTGSRVGNMFVKPLVPKCFTKIDKTSPQKELPQSKKSLPVSDQDKSNSNPEDICDIKTNTESVKSTSEVSEYPQSEQKGSQKNTIKPGLSMPSVVPLKFHRQSLDLIKNPLINKNLSDFKTTALKTKILVIKPIKNKDGSQATSTPLKFQTIKLKDPSKKSLLSEDNKTDQVVLVKVPKIKCANVATEVDTDSIDTNIAAEINTDRGENICQLNNKELNEHSSNEFNQNKDDEKQLNVCVSDNTKTQEISSITDLNENPVKCEIKK